MLCFGGHFEFLIHKRSGSAKSGIEITEIPSSLHVVILILYVVWFAVNILPHSLAMRAITWLLFALLAAFTPVSFPPYPPSFSTRFILVNRSRLLVPILNNRCEGDG